MARTLTLNKTYAQMQALIASNGLDTQTFYKITDRGDRGLLFRAAATNKLESEGLRYMLCPATHKTDFTDDYNNHWQGVWHSELNASLIESDLVIWNGLVWLTGATLSGDSPDTEGSGFTLIPKASFTNHEYIEMVFGVTYDFQNDWISKQWDSSGNELGLAKNLGLIYEITDGSYNPIDWCDWNYSSSGKIFGNNKCIFIFNNSTFGHIFANNIGTFIFNNRCGDIIRNNNIGEISNVNIGGNVFANSSSVNNIKNINQVGFQNISIIKNNNHGDITGAFDADVTDPIVDKTGTAA